MKFDRIHTIDCLAKSRQIFMLAKVCSSNYAFIPNQVEFWFRQCICWLRATSTFQNCFQIDTIWSNLHHIVSHLSMISMASGSWLLRTCCTISIQRHKLQLYILLGCMCSSYNLLSILNSKYAGFYWRNTCNSVFRRKENTVLYFFSVFYWFPIKKIKIVSLSLMSY